MSQARQTRYFASRVKHETSAKCDSPPLISRFALVLCKMLRSPPLADKAPVMQASTGSPELMG